MKWYQRPKARLVFRLATYSIFCVTMLLFLQLMAEYASNDAEYSYERTAADYLLASIGHLAGSAIFGLIVVGPGSLALGSLVAALLGPSHRARSRPRFVRFLLVSVVALVTLPAFLELPVFISLQSGGRARLIGLLILLPLGLALRWSKLAADKYISEVIQGEDAELAPSPRKTMVWRAAGYSVAFGVPVMTAYVWLYVTVADTWYTMDGPVFLLLACLIAGVPFLALLGGIFGSAMALATKLTPARLHGQPRFRVLVSLLPLLFLIPVFLPLQPYAIERFWWKLQTGFTLEKLDAAGWLLAIAMAVGICQIVFAEYQREVAAPKNDNPIRLWRAFPLAKVVAALVACSALISILSYSIYVSIFESETATQTSQVLGMLRAAHDGLAFGTVFGATLALTIMLFFNEIRRPRLFRLTVIGVALLAAIPLWRRFFDYALSRSLLDPDHIQQILPQSLELVLVVGTTVVLAELYRRAATTDNQKRSGYEQNLRAS